MQYNLNTRTFTVNAVEGLTKDQAVKALLDTNPGWPVSHANNLLAEVVRMARIRSAR